MVMVVLKTGGDASAACEVAAKSASPFPSGVLGVDRIRDFLLGRRWR